MSEPDDAAALTADDATDLDSRIIRAAWELIREGGADAATTRAVATRAGVQAPSIYRRFGDKEGLINAVAEAALATFVREKASRPAGADAVEDLRHGWDNYVDFGLANPTLSGIISRNPQSPAAMGGMTVLRQRVAAVAASGRLKVSEEFAVQMIHAAAVGVVVTQIAAGSEARNLSLSRAAREATLGALMTDLSTVEAPDVKAAAITLKARLAQTDALSPGETMLMAELLARIVDEDPLVRKLS